MASLTVENYIKAIYQIASVQGGASVATGQLAETLGVSPGTVTSMLKALNEGKLATYAPYEGVRLTAAGNALALRVVRRHRLIELFLVRTLDLSWDQVHEEAEHMEHAVSDLLIDRIDDFLGHPQEDPHGDPIPKPDGTIDAAIGRALGGCRAGQRFRLVRVLDQSPRFLRYLSESGLAPGACGEVLQHCQEAGVISVRVGTIDMALGRQAADKLLVVEPFDDRAGRP